MIGILGKRIRKVRNLASAAKNSRQEHLRSKRIATLDNKNNPTRKYKL